MMDHVLIAAVDRNWVIGKDNTIPWKCSEDMKHFKETTTNSVVVMGTKTFESMGKKFLKNRLNIVLSRSEDYLIKCDITKEYGLHINDITDVRDMANMGMFAKWIDVYYIGGEQIYQQALWEKIVNKMIITHIDIEVDQSEGTIRRFPNDELFVKWDEWEKTDTKKISDIASVVTYLKR